MRHRELTTKLEANEAGLKDKLHLLSGMVETLEEEKAKSDKEKSRYMHEAMKNQQKHEEEVQIRLYFESKLNSLHHLNRELASKVSALISKDLVQKHEDELRYRSYQEQRPQQEIGRY